VTSVELGWRRRTNEEGEDQVDERRILDTDVSAMTSAAEERALWLVENVLPHEGELRAWLSSRRLPSLEIDDIIQETYTRLVAAESVAAVRDPRTYAFSTAHSVILTHVRRARVVSFQAMADLDVLGVVSPDPAPERQLLDRQELRRLAEAIASMPAKTAQIFSLRRVHGLSQRQIANQLGLPESTVEKHISRAIHTLMVRFGRGGKPGSRASNNHDGQKDSKTADRLGG
jgi:RNA polymerase sigma-70 factor (ECF subfamily)